ncbi:glutamine amidotransferase family protein [Candidatus Woesearchaeota archaeon]|nr:glutamine amidotransferase family protein [Candidatus Woesearchaeota archaeon]
MVIQSGCSTAGILDKSGKRFGSSDIVNSMKVMNERNNGLGAGFAVYGLYPENKDEYAFHVIYNNDDAKEKGNELISKQFRIISKKHIPCEKRFDVPMLYKYFLKVDKKSLINIDEESYVVHCVDKINSVPGSFVMSSGKNMGVFKGVGYPEEIAQFYKLDKYKGHMWIAHGRFPTNTPGSWFGAHPFNLLDVSVVHNGEVSSYGANKRFLEGFGYRCSLKTDTEVFVYILDLLKRKHELSLNMISRIMAPPFWNIPKTDLEKKETEITRRIYAGAIVNGPFSIIVGHKNGMFGLNDRIKLRPMVAAEKGNLFMIASEEAALKKTHSNFDRLWTAEAGVPVVGELNVK